MTITGVFTVFGDKSAHALLLSTVGKVGQDIQMSGGEKNVLFCFLRIKSF